MEPEVQNLNCFIIAPQNAGDLPLLGKFTAGGAFNQQPTLSWITTDVHYHISIRHISPSQIEGHIQELCQDFSIYAFVYSVASKKSFDDVKNAINVLKSKGCFTNWQKGIVVGNCTEESKREVTKQEGIALGKQIGLFREMSQHQTIDVEDFYRSILHSTPIKSQLSEPQQLLPFSLAAPPQVELCSGPESFSQYFNCLLIGAQKTGKTSFVYQLVDHSFNENYIPTIGIDFKMKYVKFAEKTSKVAIWETSGQQRFQTISTSYYRGAKLFFILYDLTDLQTFHKAQHYSHLIDKFTNRNDVTVALVANKADCSEEQRKIPLEDGYKMAEQMGALFFEISCKDEGFVENCFLKAVECYIVRNKLF